jgi:hypothetical protein
MGPQAIIRPPGLGFSILLDGTVVEVTGQCGAYADLAPGAVILNAGRMYDPTNYLDVTVRQDGENRLIHLALCMAGPDFGTQAPPHDCPGRFFALYGAGWRRRRAPRQERSAYSEAMARLDEIAARQARAARETSPDEQEWLRKAELATVEKLHRAAVAAHPDRGGDTAQFQKLWPLYQAALRDFKTRWGRASF